MLDKRISSSTQPSSTSDTSSNANIGFSVKELASRVGFAVIRFFTTSIPKWWNSNGIWHRIMMRNHDEDIDLQGRASALSNDTAFKRSELKSLENEAKKLQNYDREMALHKTFQDPKKKEDYKNRTKDSYKRNYIDATNQCLDLEYSSFYATYQNAESEEEQEDAIARMREIDAKKDAHRKEQVEATFPSRWEALCEKYEQPPEKPTFTDAIPESKVRDYINCRSVATQLQIASKNKGPDSERLVKHYVESDLARKNVVLLLSARK